MIRAFAACVFVVMTILFYISIVLSACEVALKHLLSRHEKDIQILKSKAIAAEI
jgi:hypothetical protein